MSVISRDETRVLYKAYELNVLAGLPATAAFRLTADVIDRLPDTLSKRRSVRRVWAACDIMARSHATHTRPGYAIDFVRVGDEQVAISEWPTMSTPFGTLIHFRKAARLTQPRVLVVGPMSGHFTTLIRATIRSLLADHDVYVLDWNNARDIPLEHGPFGLDDYIDHVMAALRHLGPGANVVAVCQPAVPVLAAVALLAAANDTAQPDTMTLIAGPIDTRINPNRVDNLAVNKPLSYFEARAIDTVPSSHAGAGRRVYPGFLQLAAFLLLDPKRHVAAHVDMYRNMVKGNTEKASRTRGFYDDYGAVMDMPAEFYLETVSRVFQQHLLPRGEFRSGGELVDLTAIRKTALLTVEGGNDEICPPGQTFAAHELCTRIPKARKRHHLQEGVGHYGVFSGSRWQSEIYPVVTDFIRSNSPIT
jgi:poly(3-hydroxybutyrate) depolymerase